MLANTPPMLEAHYGVPMTGAVLHSINTRLDAAVVAFQLDHANAKIVICDREFAPVMREALAKAKAKPLVIDYDDRQFPQPGPALSENDYEAFLAVGDPAFRWRMPRDEWDAITLNYTSGTTGNPKGVVYSHRGATLMCYANLVAAEHGQASRLPVDAADVPLQRLVLSLDAVGGGGHARVPAGGCGPKRDLRRHRRAQGHAPVRRADRHVDAARRQAGRAARRCRAPCSSSRRPRRRRGGARGHGGGGIQRHPRLRPDRGLRSRRRQRLARAVGRLPDAAGQAAHKAARVCAILRSRTCRSWTPRP